MKFYILTIFTLIYCSTIWAQVADNACNCSHNDDIPTTYKCPQTITHKNPDGTFNHTILSRKDSDNRDVLYEKWLWSKEQHEWIGFQKNEWEYDKRGNQILFANYTWDSISHRWMEAHKVEKLYDDEKNIIMTSPYIWDRESGDWVGQYDKHEYEYKHPKERFRTKDTRYKWSKEDKNWEPVSIEETFYNSNGDFVFGYEYKWGDGDWMPTKKHERFYNKKGKDFLSISYIWDEETRSWINIGKSETEYYEKKIASSTWFHWDRSNQEWKDRGKKDYIYNADNTFEEIIEYTWDTDAEVWIEKSRTKY